MFSAVAGKPPSARANPGGVLYGRRESIGSLESGRYFGLIRAPVRGTLLAVNEEVLRTPRLLSDAPYGDGWFARLRPEDWRGGRGTLRTAPGAKDPARS